MAEKPFGVMEKLSRGLAETWVGPTPQRRKHGAYCRLACDYQLSLRLWLYESNAKCVSKFKHWKRERKTANSMMNC
ncbi:hypothetical protein ACLKA6_003367 [Drosophila palustris]